MSELLDTERAYVEELLCVLEVRLDSGRGGLTTMQTHLQQLLGLPLALLLGARCCPPNACERAPTAAWSQLPQDGDPLGAHSSLVTADQDRDPWGPTAAWSQLPQDGDPIGDPQQPGHSCPRQGPPWGPRAAQDREPLRAH
ncbi:hypothetical protein P7K49_000079 [Saguinus oedipus]|uniref:DH domain-containing protein n=1 Tax=Saguinus oedipus TaxID=9490 RepID=A0ABQ9WAN2_SAGOE|nr:hypothetical protein P7K49_000079 [Saguinus oedipus]